jgi:ABC-type branched-subunit amino acid transport system substrate-binding protein
VMLQLRRNALCALGLIGSLAATTGCSTRSVPPLEPPMSVRRGDEAFQYQDYKSAIEYYQTYLDHTWHGAYVPVVAYQCALAEYRLKHYQATITTLDDLQKRYPDTHWVQVQALRGDADRALGNDTLALLAWDEGWDLGTSAEQDKLRLRIVTLAKRMSPEQLASARQFVTNDEVRDLLVPSTGTQAPSSRLAAPMPEFEEGVEPGEVAPPPPTPSRASVTAQQPGYATAPADKSAFDSRGSSSMQGFETEPVAPSQRDWELGEAAAPPPSGPARTPASTSAPRRAHASAPVPSPAAVASLPAEGMAGGADTNAPSASAAPIGAAPAPPQGVAALDGARIGVLLSMSGRHDSAGERAWRAIQLAFGEQANRLMLKNTGGDSAATRRVLNEVWHDQGIVAVLGPVTAADAEAVAELAEQDKMPLLPLSQHDTLNGRFVLQMGLTRAELIGRLLDYAVSKARLQRFGVLYPDDANGRAFLQTFRAGVAQRGGTIVGTGKYAPGANVVSQYGNTLFQWREKGDLEALFLADDSATAAQVAGFLEGEMPDVTLLGAQSWGPLAGEIDLNGVLFADGFFAGSARPATRAFVEKYQQVYGQTPGALEARAYDAAILVKRALDAGATTRSDMINQLEALGPVDGATGSLRVTAAGLQRSVFLLRVYKGTLEEVGAVG